jgi:hypothetical protein
VSHKRRFERGGKSESAAEIRYRLHNEGEARKLAEKIKGMIEPGLSFVLITCTQGDSSAGFSNMSYISTVRRPDAARLLCEMLDYWENEGTVTEPRVETATQLREAVSEFRELHLDDLRKLIGSCVEELNALTERGAPFGETGTAGLGLAALGIAVYDQLKRSQASAAKKEGESNARSSN